MVHHDSIDLLCLLFDIAEGTWWTIPWTRDLQVTYFHVNAGHQVLTLEPVQLLKVFLQGVWQVADIKSLIPPLPGNAKLIIKLNFATLYLAGGCSEGEGRVQGDNTGHTKLAKMDAASTD